MGSNSKIPNPYQPDLPPVPSVIYTLWLELKKVFYAIHSAQLFVNNQIGKVRNAISAELILADKVISNTKYVAKLVAIFGFVDPIANQTYRIFRNKVPRSVSSSLGASLNTLNQIFDTMQLGQNLQNITSGYLQIFQNTKTLTAEFTNLSANISKSNQITTSQLKQIQVLIPAISGNLSDIARAVPTLGVPLRIVNEIKSTLDIAQNISDEYDIIAQKIQNLQTQKNHATFIRFDLIVISFLDRFTQSMPTVSYLLKLFGL